MFFAILFQKEQKKLYNNDYSSTCNSNSELCYIFNYTKIRGSKNDKKTEAKTVLDRL